LFAEKDFSLLRDSLVYLINGIKIIAFLLLPITPETSNKIISHLNIKISDINLKNVSDFKSIENKKLKKLTGHLFS